MGKGEVLNERVWKLFSKLGFQTKPNFQDPDEEIVSLAKGKIRKLDLLAVDQVLGVKIIGWNKTSPDLSESLTVHLHDYIKLKEKVGAQSALFVVTEMDLSEDEFSYAEELGARIWTTDELKYYETLVETIGEFAKYEVIHTLGIKTKQENWTFHALALHLRQPFADSDQHLFLFSAPPEFLLKTSVVLRKAAGSKDAYQRIIQRRRLLQIRDFVTTDNAILPPNIIVHFGEKVSWEPIQVPAKDKSGKPINLTRSHDYELVSLSIPSEFASLEIIDGQHRLFGFAHTEPATRKQFNLVVLGLANLSRKRRTETFVSINDTARRMNPNLVLYLKYDPDESTCQADQELMAIKIAVELNKTTPLKRKIQLLDVGNEQITLKGFAGYDLKGLLGDRGRLKKHYPQHNSKEYVRVLRMYFSTLKEVFPKQWADPNRDIIFTNRGVSAFLKLFRSMLRTVEGPLSHVVIKRYLLAIRDDWADKDWVTKNLKSSYVGSGGWKDFHRDLVKSVRTQFKDFEE